MQAEKYPVPQEEVSIDKYIENPYNILVIISGYSAVGSALVSGTRGRGFDSRYSDQKKDRPCDGLSFLLRTDEENPRPLINQRRTI